MASRGGSSGGRGEAGQAASGWQTELRSQSSRTKLEPRWGPQARPGHYGQRHLPSLKFGRKPHLG